MAQSTATATIVRSAGSRDSVDVGVIAARIPDAPSDVRGSREGIAAAVAAIVERVRPEQVVLFGSRAYGTPTWESDIDLMVILESPLERRVLLEDLRTLVRHDRASATASFDIHTRTPDRIALGLAEGDFFIQDVMLKGVSLYDNGQVRVTTKDDAIPRRDPSKPTQATLGWVKKAESDLRVAQLVLSGSDVDDDASCFHAQQAAEKYLKALLQERDVRFPRTHDLEKFGDLAAPMVVELGGLRSGMEWLSAFSVDSRYPDAIEEPEPDAPRAIAIATEIRRLIRAVLGLDG